MSDLSRDAIAAAGLADTLGDVLAQPHQIGDALWRTESAGIPRRDLAGGLLVAGPEDMGAGAELAAAALGRDARRPVRALHHGTLEPWTRADTLVLCASYSGDDEEALAAFEDATAREAPRAVLTTAGRLASRAREERVPVIGVPSGMAPSAAVVYAFVATLECAALCGAAPSRRAEVEGAQAVLERVAAENGPDAPDGAPAKALARELHGGVPVVYGKGVAAAGATRWAAQVVASAGIPAFAATHEPPRHDALRPLLLDASETGDRLAPEDVPQGSVRASGENPVERALALTLLGDLVAVYLAVLGGV